MDITQDFIDERFKAYVLEMFCGNRERIHTSDVDHIESLKLANQGYSSLRGIEHFKCLEELDCSSNHLIELDISSNINLKTLNCGFNRIRNLDVSHNNQLAKLVCYWNILSELRLDQNTNLRELDCSYNSLFDLQLECNSQLIYLNCGNNYLINLSIEGCVDLIEIRCNHNHLTKLDITGSPKLQSLRCFNNHIAELELSHNALITELYCAENKIIKLDTHHNPKLEGVDYSNNLIMEPDHTVQGVGAFEYDVSFPSYKSALQFMEQELSLRANVSNKADIERLSPIIKKVWANLTELNDKALNRIAELHPDEDVSELVLSELEFDKDNMFRLGYNAGETPAGHLYIYVAFNNELEIIGDLVYETY
ncbi:leucine-rich repeat domain-containing protein [Paenibacillus solani]|uniref:Leucine-rich repeat domain-containing protein n=1 Tax=Paenibacillus solani TaxID=1705565 RepID=A0A0M1P1U6_9BACL|nr:hypothetical protein [Paenibacillus solani]KOR88054.1 hypothetical protein AM231_02125 [Paenibacillus solani]